MADPKVSVAIPLYNEEESAPELVGRLRGVLESLPGGPHEMVFVDDGSTDRTIDVLQRELSSSNRVSGTIVSLSRNFGHQKALSAAIDHATGDVVILMDGDLQDPPEAIPALLDRYRQGFDVVYAQRSARDAPWYLRAAYFLFYRVLGFLSDTKLPVDSGDFSLLSRQVVDAIRSSPEQHRYLRGLRAWAGFRQIGLPLPRPARAKGTSKYSMRKLLGLALDGIFSFSQMPLRFAAFIGGMAILLCVAYAVYAVFAKLVLHQSPQGFTALIVVIVFISGVQMMFLGVIGEYVGRIYNEVKGRPHYIVRRVLRHGAADGSAV